MASNEYNLAEAFQRIENELMASMIRNMDRHRAEETEEGYNWSMWQAEQLKALEKYKRNNQRKYRKQFKNINNQIEELIRQARQTGNMQQEIRILQAIKKGWKVHGKNKSPAHQTMIAEFFKLNDRKLEALIKATRQDMEKAETAVLRKAEDDYRKAIFNAQVYANTGSGTYEKAVDMATKDMLSRGLNCVEYANGARHTLADYADMAIRTASKRAYLQGEGEKRQEWGVTTVIMAKRGNPCPKCLPFVGKVLIDDVWSGGRSDGVDPETGKRYPVMSYAISKGLYHPRCKDSHTTYFPGISTADDTWTEEELKKVGLQAKQEVRQQYAQRQMEKYDRLAKYSLDPENKEDYDRKASEWEKRQSMNALTVNQEGAIIRYVSPDAYVLNDKLRRNAISELTNTEKEWMENLDSALRNLPTYEGNLNRSVTFLFEEDAQKYFDSFIEGAEYVPRQYLSTTKNGVYNDDAQVQIYIQNAKNGRDLGKLNDMESEVLYPFMSRFRVLNKVKQDGKFYILLEELE